MKGASQNYIPPKYAKRFLKWYCKPDLYEDISGDIEEDFNQRYTSHGSRSARVKYTLDVIRFFRPFAVRKLFKTQINISMFSINSRIALRNLGKHKLYSFINISGLALGIAACLVIAHYVAFQLSFDTSFQHSDKLYRVHMTRHQSGVNQGTDPNVGFGLGPAITEAAPEIEKASLIHFYYDGAIVSKVKDSIASTPFQETDLIFVEPAFIDMFSLEFLSGNPKTALDNPNSVIITESIWRKYFGENASLPLGEILNIDGSWGERGAFTISGVIADFPDNSHLAVDILLPMSNLMKDSQYKSDGAAWGWSNFELYVQLIPQTTEGLVEEKVSGLMQKYVGEEMEQNSEERVLSLQSIQDLHLRSDVTGEEGAMNSIYFLVLIGAFILVIAWINFINLSTAKAAERSREVGVKKAMGALKKQIIQQFLTESFWLNLFATILGVFVAFLLLPKMGNIIGEEFKLDLTNQVTLILIGSMIFIGPLLAGIYPAFVMSAFKTTDSLKGNKNLGTSKVPLRKVLVVFQFVISTLMIAGTYVVSEQLDYMRNQSTGFEMEKILIVQGPRTRVQFESFQKFRNETSALAAVESFASSRSIPGAGYNWGTEMYKFGADKSSRKSVSVTWVDSEFIPTYELEMIAGRDFSDPINEAEDVNVANGAIINEATLEAYNLGTPEEALGEKLVISGTTMPIRGVTKDHNWKSLHSKITPSVFMYTVASKDYFSIKLNMQNTEETISAISGFYAENFPGNPIEYHFMNDFFNEQYKADREFGQIFNSFAVFAIVAACLGLFGLTAFSMLQKAKEIGIRKVLGAKMSHITYLFSKNYLVLILVANGLAIPLSYFSIEYWLQDFAYKIPITAKLFIIPVVLLMFIALITITFQTIKVARSNPIKSLRAE
ncbi:ABC transporter permease [Roseivirga sp. E12]|uniref:ABC transporter permease n=1 Tax=Roseivirga sp. E12 TaxID=2819237 RepID=UPI001ABCAB55|nr:ABC transporter permease [Roseivirga sp. E12]